MEVHDEVRAASEAFNSAFDVQHHAINQHRDAQHHMIRQLIDKYHSLYDKFVEHHGFLPLGRIRLLLRTDVVLSLQAWIDYHLKATSARLHGDVNSLCTQPRAPRNGQPGSASSNWPPMDILDLVGLFHLGQGGLTRDFARSLSEARKSGPSLDDFLTSLVQHASTRRQATEQANRKKGNQKARTSIPRFKPRDCTAALASITSLQTPASSHCESEEDVGNEEDDEEDAGIEEEEEGKEEEEGQERVSNSEGEHEQRPVQAQTEDKQGVAVLSKQTQDETRNKAQEETRDDASAGTIESADHNNYTAGDGFDSDSDGDVGDDADTDSNDTEPSIEVARHAVPEKRRRSLSETPFIYAKKRVRRGSDQDSGSVSGRDLNPSILPGPEIHNRGLFIEGDGDISRDITAGSQFSPSQFDLEAFPAFEISTPDDQVHAGVPDVTNASTSGDSTEDQVLAGIPNQAGAPALRQPSAAPTTTTLPRRDSTAAPTLSQHDSVTPTTPQLDDTVESASSAEFAMADLLSAGKIKSATVDLMLPLVLPPDWHVVDSASARTPLRRYKPLDHFAPAALPNILLPMCDDVHWVLVAIYPGSHKFVVSDSLSHTKYPIKTWQLRAWRFCRQLRLETESWEWVIDQECFRQADAINCGVFAILNAALLDTEIPRTSIPSTQADTKVVRLVLAAVLAARYGEIDDLLLENPEFYLPHVPEVPEVQPLRKPLSIPSIRRSMRRLRKLELQHRFALTGSRQTLNQQGTTLDLLETLFQQKHATIPDTAGSSAEIRNAIVTIGNSSNRRELALLAIEFGLDPAQLQNKMKTTYRRIDKDQRLEEQKREGYAKALATIKDVRSAVLRKGEGVDAELAWEETGKDDDSNDDGL